MAKQRDVTALEPLTSFSDSGYVIVVQDSEIYALPKVYGPAKYTLSMSQNLPLGSLSLIHGMQV